MSTFIVLQQMVIIFILIGIGMILYRRRMISEEGSKQISGLIINVTNPALLICSALEDGPKASLRELGAALAAYAVVFAVLIGISFLLPRILRVPKHLHYAYQMLTVFGNVGFIGIPLSSAVLGSESLIYVSIFNLLFNLLIYTFGISLLQRAAARQTAEDISSSLGAASESAAVPAQNMPENTVLSASDRLKKLINAGTISAAVTIFLYLSNIRVPVILSDALSYTGRATTLLSMLVLGVSVAQMAPKDIFSHPKLYAFTLLRQILIPIGCVLLMRSFLDHKLILNTMLLMVAVPAANMPLMLAKQMDMDTGAISQGIILTTVLSLITVPAACLFLT
ncbi:MAG: AEC family transporter [Bacteroidales bacterium]|nr:AEC family transporter [Bacteroidales bacterium]MCM1414766.1 AEC family transporter [bacterium]MCM1423228.1 AEC family transporter [bacterium]